MLQALFRERAFAAAIAMILATSACGVAGTISSSTDGSDGEATGATTSASTGATGGGEATSSTGTGVTTCIPASTAVCFDGPPAIIGVGRCRSGVHTCLGDGSGYGSCMGQVLAAPAEDCSTPEDDDCDGVVVDPAAGCVCVPGATASCYDGPAGTKGVGLCVEGKKTCNPDGKTWGSCAGEVVPAPETCATLGDDDCNGVANDKGTECLCVPGAVSDCYSGPPMTLGIGPCKTGEQVCNLAGTGFGPCTDEVVPVAETCSTPIDDNCDGQVNEGCAPP